MVPFLFDIMLQFEQHYQFLNIYFIVVGLRMMAALTTHVALQLSCVMRSNYNYYNTLVPDYNTLMNLN